jgi:hypothetical protein
LKIRYTPDAGTANGSFTFLFPAATKTMEANDGKADPGGYDFNMGTAAIVCPTVDGNYTSWVASASASMSNNASMGLRHYHSFTCSYAGTSTVDPVEFVITGLINPAPQELIPEFEEDRTIGSYYVQGILGVHYDQGGAQATSGNSYVGYGGTVKMTVKVLPQLTFILTGVNENEAVCNGLTANVTSTGYLVPFGSISNTNFIDAAQKIRVTTNAPNGYVVTAIANDQMGLEGRACVGAGNVLDCIPGFGSKTAPAVWTVNDGRGFGYTLEVRGGDTYMNALNAPNVMTPFNTVDGWRSFADRENGDAPIQVVSNTKSTNGDDIDVCYRIMSAASNVPGDYKSLLTYTVTASF